MIVVMSEAMTEGVMGVAVPFATVKVIIEAMEDKYVEGMGEPITQLLEGQQ